MMIFIIMIRGSHTCFWNEVYAAKLHYCAKSCAENCLRQNTFLLKIIEFVNPHGGCTKYVHDVRNSYSRLELLVCRNRKVGPGICCRFEVELWPPGVGPKAFT